MKNVAVFIRRGSLDLTTAVFVREARVRRNALQCPGFLDACCGQGQIVRALLFACWMDLFVQPAQPLHALDGVIHLVLLNVFQFVYVETFRVSFGDENKRYSEFLCSRWIQPKARQAVHVTVADECVVANRRTGIARWQVWCIQTKSFKGAHQKGSRLRYQSHQWYRCSMTGTPITPVVPMHPRDRKLQRSSLGRALHQN